MTTVLWMLGPVPGSKRTIRYCYHLHFGFSATCEFFTPVSVFFVVLVLLLDVCGCQEEGKTWGTA